MSSELSRDELEKSFNEITKNMSFFKKHLVDLVNTIHVNFERGRTDLTQLILNLKCFENLESFKSFSDIYNSHFYKYISTFHEILAKYSSHLKIDDTTMFNSGLFYAKAFPLAGADNLNFCDMWDEIDDVTKKTIIIKLFGVYEFSKRIKISIMKILSYNIDIESVRKEIDQIDMGVDECERLKIKEVMDDIFGTVSDRRGEVFDIMSTLGKGNSEIIAKYIESGLLGKGPEELFSSILSGSGDKIDDLLPEDQRITQNFKSLSRDLQTKLQNKIGSGEITEKDLIKITQQLTQRVPKLSQNHPEIASVIQSLAEQAGTGFTSMYKDSAKRDDMAKKLQDLMSSNPYKTIVAVVGAGHIDGMRELLESTKYSYSSSYTYEGQEEQTVGLSNY